VYPNQNINGSIIMKKVWVPRFAVSAKYESRNGVRQCSYKTARRARISRVHFAPKKLWLVPASTPDTASPI
jgi:hypothetical protein